MPGYHKYVFDTERRAFVGDFEAMYQAEDTEGFDSWRERDLRELRKAMSYTVLNGYNFSRILELGCGKGSFTHLLKKKNNQVVALDISEAAIRKASYSYPDIDFRCGGIAEVSKMAHERDRFDLVLVMGTFAYIEPWPEFLEIAAKISQWLYVAEYVPPDPIGFVKSFPQLVGEVEKHFAIRTKILLDDEHCMLLAERKA